MVGVHGFSPKPGDTKTCDTVTFESAQALRRASGKYLIPTKPVPFDLQCVESDAKHILLVCAYG